MSNIALRVIELVKSLPPADQQTIVAALSHDPAQPVLYGEPLTDDDIAETARVTFSALDADESKT